ncbi:very low-density lipoprotein receptor-like [Frankliniella occidentalis]|uniref:Very low-density lipoprotein receptor-like n=1 Tax=Frankliniella occidentalis TaxID=133901 RepID=A0A6J1S192_FRAOC|nr:very low-density lipoprotein receptor-like [Frankliniella occidentalis]
MASARARGLRGLLAVAVLLLATGASQGAGCNTEVGFACGEGRCIDKKYVCDGNINCNSGADERNCTECAATAVFCEGRCAHRCDGIARCADGADEVGCPTRPVFECSEGSTVLASKQCDGIKNCDNGMDEEGCSYPEDCRGGAVFCDGRCLPAASRCDRVIWCSNGADEKGCPWWPL